MKSGTGMHSLHTLLPPPTSPFSSSPHPALKSTRVPPYCAPRSPRQGDGPVMRLSWFRSFEGVSVGLPLLPRGCLGGTEGSTPPATPPARVRLGGGGGCVCACVCTRARARWRAAGGREERSGRQRAEREGAGGQRWGGRGAAPGFSSDTRERSHTPSSEPRESGANRAAHTPPPRAPSSPRAALQPGAGAQSGRPWSPRRLPSQLQHPPAARPPHSPCLLKGPSAAPSLCPGIPPVLRFSPRHFAATSAAARRQPSPAFEVCSAGRKVGTLRPISFFSFIRFLLHPPPPSPFGS